jgi:hypothetical protein
MDELGANVDGVKVQPVPPARTRACLTFRR